MITHANHRALRSSAPGLSVDRAERIAGRRAALLRRYAQAPTAADPIALRALTRPLLATANRVQSPELSA